MSLTNALVLLGLVVLAPFASAQTFEELRDRVIAERDAIEDGEVRQLGEFETREAMEALLAAYDRFASPYRRREVVIELKRFDDHEESFQPALEKLMQVAVEEPSLEVRTAALESLGLCVQNGPNFLAIIVESNADDSIRERAMELHVRLSGDSSDGWYRKIYERSLGSVQEELRGADSKKRKGRRRRGDEEEAEEKKQIIWPTARLRATAMGAIIEALSSEDL
ncbi:MAG: HEAT repeat domain-containing protein, partial [Planctomycetota bacterium]|nr:HEAT repeat domain-containing protein [Planctomycetota bacterium]